MSGYLKVLAEDRRLSILLLLDASPGMAANEALLSTAITDFGHYPTADQLRADLAWLAEQQLLSTSDVHGLVVATLSERGADAAHGRAVVPGVKRPRPKG